MDAKRSTGERPPLTPERWRRVREVMDGFFELPAGEREEFMDRACAGDRALRREAESLIQAYESAGTFIDQPAAELGAAAALSDRDEETADGLDRGETGAHLGDYQLLAELGRGGMGTVYLARRADGAYEQDVAIKVLHGELATRQMVARFRGERQILARLDHPSIAKLLDGGATDDGRPFFVMEHVDGVPVDRHARDRGLSIRQRLELFCRICRAVHFAHQNLVVHRDLKPGNILVAETGEPKLLDFGIAKLLAPESFPQTVVPTAPGGRLLTPGYASPEQLSGGAVTTASDVFSLGVVLCELLTGRRLFDPDRGDQDPVEPVLRPGPPTPPSALVSGRTDAALGDPRRLRRRLAGDLDNIVLTALCREPGRRYSSAESLAHDVERHLEGLPVKARRDTWLYRTGKFVTRHRAGVATAAGVIAVLVGFLAVLLIQRGRILEQRNLATGVSDFLVRMFELPDPHHGRGQDVRASDLLRQGAREIEWKLRDQPGVRAELLDTMGRSFQGLGLFDEAEPLLASSLELRRGLHGDEHPSVAASLLSLGELKSFAGDLATGEALVRQALDQLEGDASDEAARCHLRLARILSDQGEYESSEHHFRTALALAEQLGLGETRALVLDRYAMLALRLGRFVEAESMFRNALGIYHRLYGETYPQVALTLANLAAVHEAKGEYDDAEDLLRQALAIQRQLFDTDHPHQAGTLHNLAYLLRRRGRYDEARGLFEEVLEMHRRLYGEAHPAVAMTLYNLAGVHKDLGDRPRAEDLYRQSLESRRELLGDEHPDTAASCDALAQLLANRGELDQAEELYAQALEIRLRVFGEEHAEVAATLNNLAGLAQARRQYPRAEELYRRALAVLRRLHGEEHENVATARYNLGALLHRMERYGDAGDEYSAALAGLRRALGEGHARVGLVTSRIGQLKIDADQPAEAESLALSALEILRTALPEDHAWTTSAEGVLGRSLLAQRRYADAEPWLVGRYEKLRSSRGDDAAATVRARAKLVELYEAWPDPAKAARYRNLRIP